MSSFAALQQLTNERWFFALDLMGVVVSAIAGVMRAHRGRYDFFGAFVLAFLGAVGGGTVRDLLVGGDRHPPFIFKDPIYVELVIAVVILGAIVSKSKRWKPSEASARRMSLWLEIFDAMALACFTVIGAKVAIGANLHWLWIPLFSALTCAGGGVMRDVVCGSEPGTLKGEIYEEVAFGGGLLFVAIAEGVRIWSHPKETLITATLVVMAAVFASRMWVVARGIKSPTLGSALVEEEEISHRGTSGIHQKAA